MESERLNRRRPQKDADIIAEALRELRYATDYQTHHIRRSASLIAEAILKSKGSQEQIDEFVEDLKESREKLQQAVIEATPIT